LFIGRTEKGVLRQHTFFYASFNFAALYFR